MGVSREETFVEGRVFLERDRDKGMRGLDLYPSSLCAEPVYANYLRKGLCLLYTLAIWAAVRANIIIVYGD